MSSMEPSQIILQFVKIPIFTKTMNYNKGFSKTNSVLRDALAFVEIGNIILVMVKIMKA